MDRMKTFLKYALWVIGFFIFSEFLINVGLNSNYNDIERRDSTSQVSVYQADATMVNGRIKGIITNKNNELTNKYVKISFYSKRNVFLGSRYIQVEDSNKNDGSQAFEAFFKLREVQAYDISIVNEPDKTDEIELIPTEWKNPQVWLVTAMAILIFWG